MKIVVIGGTGLDRLEDSSAILRQGGHEVARRLTHFRRQHHHW